jgi:hypothetical protein
MRRTTIVLILSLIVNLTFAQDKKSLNNAPAKTWYGMSGSELIFSAGKLIDHGAVLGNKTRFSLFLHVQNQMHYDFAKYIGVYTGFGIKNVGFINTIRIPNQTDANIKQRCYSLGIPFAIKLGKMERGNYLAIGGEEELMFNYKRKIFYNGNKSKTSEWFSKDVTRFNPSVFAELHFHKGSYIRFKSYLNNFLVNRSTPFYLPKTGILVDYKPEQSSLFYVSIGTVLKVKKKKPATLKDV